MPELQDSEVWSLEYITYDRCSITRMSSKVSLSIHLLKKIINSVLLLDEEGMIVLYCHNLVHYIPLTCMKALAKNFPRLL